MFNQVSIGDNVGNGSVIPSMATPVAGSGQTLTNANKDTNTTATVVAGGTYVFTAQEVGGFFFSITGTIATAANIEWACPLYQSIIIKIPEGVTTLNYGTDTNSAVGYLRKINIT